MGIPPDLCSQVESNIGHRLSECEDNTESNFWGFFGRKYFLRPGPPKNLNPPLHGLETDPNLKSECSHGGHFGKRPLSTVPHRFARCVEAHLKDNVPRHLNRSSNLVLRKIVQGSQEGDPTRGNKAIFLVGLL